MKEEPRCSNCPNIRVEGNRVVCPMGRQFGDHVACSLHPKAAGHTYYLEWQTKYNFSKKGRRNGKA